MYRFTQSKALPAESCRAVLIANNPFCDYAPESTQIQGILKGTYDGLTTNLEETNAEELAILEATLQKRTLDNSQEKEARGQ